LNQDWSLIFVNVERLHPKLWRFATLRAGLRHKEFSFLIFYPALVLQRAKRASDRAGLFSVVPDGTSFNLS